MLINDLLHSFQYFKYKEFPEIFFNYCTVLLNSGFNPIQDLIVSYLISFLKNIKHNRSRTQKLPLKLKLIARIFSLKSLKTYKEPESDDDEAVQSDSSDSELYEEDIVSKHELGSHGTSFQLNSNWLFSEDVSLKEFSHFNFNLLISRAIRYSIFLYWSKRKVLKRYFLNVWNVRFELVKRERFLITTWEKFLKKKFFVKSLLLKFVQLKKYKRSAAVFHNQLVKKHIFTRWKTRLQKAQTSKLSADQFLKHKYLNILQTKLDNAKKNYLVAEKFNNGRSAGKCLKTWRLNTACHQVSDRLRSRSSIKRGFLLWRAGYLRHQTMLNDAVLLLKMFSCGPIFIRWRQKVIDKQAKFQDACMVINESVKRRYFKQWLMISTISSKRYEFHNIQKRIMQRFVLESVFIRIYNLNTIAKGFSRENNSLRLSSYYYNWKILSGLNAKAKQLNDKRLKTNFMHQLIKQYELKMAEKYYNYKLTSKLLKHWKLQLVYRKRLRRFDVVIAKKFFMIWRESQMNSLNETLRATVISNYFVAYRYLKHWYIQCDFWLQQEQLADQVFLKNRLSQSLIKGYRNRMQTLQVQASLCLAQRNDALKSRVFTKWSSAFKKRKLNQLKASYEDYMAGKNTILTNKMFMKWQQRWQKAQELENELNIFVMRKFFLLIVKRYIEVDDLRLYAIQYYDTLLKKKTYDKLIESSNRRYDLRFRLENYINETDFKLSESYFKAWLMKSLKLKQMEETLKLFRTRWTKIKANNLLLIWQEKYYDRMLKYQDIHAITNTSNLLTSELSHDIKSPRIRPSSWIERNSLYNRKSSPRRKVSPIKSFNQQMALEEDLMNGQESQFNDLEESPLVGKQKRWASSASPRISSISPIKSFSPIKKLSSSDVNFLSSSTPFSKPNKTLPITLNNVFNTTIQTTSKTKVDNDTESDTRVEHDASILRKYDVKTPSSSRIINLSNSMIAPSSEVIKSQRLKDLKSYYNRGVKNSRY